MNKAHLVLLIFCDGVAIRSKSTWRR